jgi:hypothetical protein
MPEESLAERWRPQCGGKVSHITFKALTAVFSPKYTVPYFKEPNQVFDFVGRDAA